MATPAGAVNLLRCEATKLHPARPNNRRRSTSEMWSNPMRKIMSFAFGVLIGTIVATAWAQYHNYPTVDSPRTSQHSVQGAMNPHDMMTNTGAFPVQHHDAF
jgi:cytochrome c-type biogenesis protein CcmH/NrfG